MIFVYLLVSLALAVTLLKWCVCAHAKRGSWSPTFLVKAMETGDKNCSVMKAMHRIESCERCWAFLEWVGPWVLSPESVEYFGTHDYFSGGEKGKTLMSKSSMLHKLLLDTNESCDEYAIYFWRRLKWRVMFITFPWFFLYLRTRSDQFRKKSLNTI